MTMEEKMEMYREKNRFIEGLSAVFQTRPKGSSVTKITYEVYTKVIDEEHTSTREWVIVHFIGGGKSPRFVSGNSNTANFRVLGEMLNGGYYDEVRDYESQEERGYTLLTLNRLDVLLQKPMNHISDVHECFNYCENGNDVEKVINKIPNGFGTFDVEYNEDGETFLIINDYEENGDFQTETLEFEFYVD